ncbi:Crp/Fnr family transcriptional regulator [Chryseobacterium sp. ERMR1:04]|uniref:Crp/Fnr family transcriptional regulator n=1 Tax=Chryseobacterium sp. ERMR1:04 TaxID=1705393 RepID=UPI0006C8ACC2|nr:Crp/Fnr family transcriptional regulator [Chryseobacterium sp. ERMR1:04]KPH14825.1 hypothetical protein AMQ68_05165 [Chryseobacterium sp. ERMR1:04]
MIIKERLLKTHGAHLITLEKGEYLLRPETYAQYYYQIKRGSLKIASDKIGSNEFIHQILGRGEPVGETYLCAETFYTINAIALSSMDIYAISREKFFELLEKNPEIIIKLYQFTSLYINHQRKLINLMAYGDPRSKIIAVISYLKSVEELLEPFDYEVPYTRKQLASLTGLRTETVIRTVKLLEKENFVKIVDGKIFG